MSGFELRLLLDERQLEELAARVAIALCPQSHAPDGAVRPSSATPEYMDVPTAAQYLGIATGRLRRLIQRRAIPFHQEAPGCRVFLCRTDLIAWMDNQRYEVGL